MLYVFRTTGVRRAALPQQFHFPARRFAARGAGRAGRRARLHGARHHRRMLARRRWCARTSRPKNTSCKLLIGAEFRLDCGLRLVLLATDRAATATCRSSSRRRGGAARRAATSSTATPTSSAAPARCLVLWTARHAAAIAAARSGSRPRFPGPRLDRGGAAARRPTIARSSTRCTRLGARSVCRCVAAGDVHMHVRARRPLQDALTAVRHGVTVAEAGHALYPNGERHLRARAAARADLSTGTAGGDREHRRALRTSRSTSCATNIRDELVPAGETPASHLRKLTEAGLRAGAGPTGVPDKVRDTDRARARAHRRAATTSPTSSPCTTSSALRAASNILCQGRGSAANSAVCYCLGITAVDPARIELLFERFISRERNEPPDIDVDFEHERREEVIQYIYGKYGRDRAALAADGHQLSAAQRAARRRQGAGARRWSRSTGSPRRYAWWDNRRSLPSALREAGFDPRQPADRAQLLALVDELLGFPRHLSQHVGGFVISRGPLVRAGADRKRGDGGPHRHPVGQGRPRRRWACSRSTCWRSACCRRIRRALDLIGALARRVARARRHPAARIRASTR